VIDVNGYFAPMATGGLSLYGVTPCRVVDTRLPAGSPPITSMDVAVTSSPCGILSTAQAFVLSVTVVPPGPLGYMTLWPQGQTMPVVSTLNALDGAVTSEPGHRADYQRVDQRLPGKPDARNYGYLGGTSGRKMSGEGSGQRRKLAGSRMTAGCILCTTGESKRGNPRFGASDFTGATPDLG